MRCGFNLRIKSSRTFEPIGWYTDRNLQQKLAEGFVGKFNFVLSFVPLVDFELVTQANFSYRKWAFLRAVQEDEALAKFVHVGLRIFQLIVSV